MREVSRPESGSSAISTTCALAEPGRRVGRPSRQKKEQGGRGLGCDEPAQEFLGRAVDPVGVLDGYDERRQTRARSDDLVQKLARSEPDQDAVQRRQRPARGLVAKQIEDEIAILVRLQADARAGLRRA